MAIALLIMAGPAAHDRGIALAAAGSSDSSSKKPARSGSAQAASDEISRLVETHVADYVKGNADGWASLYAEDAVFAGTSERIDGRQAIHDYFAQVFTEKPNRTESILNRSIRVYNNGPSATAVVNLETTSGHTSSSGHQVVFRSRESLVFVKIHGKWSIVDHESWRTLKPRGKRKS